MKDWIEKVDFSTGEQSVVTMDDANSFFNEAKNVVKPFMALDESDNKQLLKSINIMSKTICYKDIGSTNHIILKHPAIDETIESYVDGVMLLFYSDISNTGHTTLSINGLQSKTVYNNGQHLTSGFIDSEHCYQVIYNSTYDRFDIFKFDTGVEAGSGAIGDGTSRIQADDGVNQHDAVNVEQGNALLLQSHVLNSVTSSSTTNAVSSNELHTLHNLLTTINNKLPSNDTSLDTLQEIVNYIKDNRHIMNGLTVNSVTNLKSTLDNKAPTSHNHDDRYYTTTESTNMLLNKAKVNGDKNQTFVVKQSSTSDSAITNLFFKDRYRAPLWDYYLAHYPTPQVNGGVDGKTWLRTDTGEFFLCTDRTHNKNVWKGTHGSLINTYTDIFSDSSSVGLYELEGTLDDTGHRNDAYTVEAIVYNTSTRVKGRYSLFFEETTAPIILRTHSDKMRSFSFYFRPINLGGGVRRFIVEYDDACFLSFDSSNDNYDIGSNNRLFIDGVKTVSIPDDDDWHHYYFECNNPINRIAIGNLNDLVTHDKASGGYIDFIRAFNKTLSDDNIKILAEEIWVNSYTDYFGDKTSIALLELEESLKDASHRVTAYVYGTPTYTTIKRFGGASFSSLIDQAGIEINPTSRLVQSVSLWFRQHGDTNDTNYLIGTTADNHYVCYDNGSSSFVVGENEKLYIDGVLSTDVPYDDVFHHICVVFGDKLGGVAIGNVYPSQTVANASCGYIDQVRLFDRVLTASEIQSLANE